MFRVLHIKCFAIYLFAYYLPMMVCVFYWLSCNACATDICQTKATCLLTLIIGVGPCTLLPVANGSIVVPDGIRPGRKVKHGSILQYDCHHGFYPGTSTTTCCHNGTWLTTPECTPGLRFNFFLSWMNLKLNKFYATSFALHSSCNAFQLAFQSNPAQFTFVALYPP